MGSGIIVGNGNIGKSLSTDVDRDFNTFLTIDGGLTWKKLRDGPHIIKMVEEIGLLILAPYNKVTREIYLTFNYGETGFHNLIFSENKSYYI